MTPNAKLDALIARIEGGEALTWEVATDVARAIGTPGAMNGFHESSDAILSLARSKAEVVKMLMAALALYETPFAPLSEPFNPEPVLRAMLLEALKARRT